MRYAKRSDERGSAAIEFVFLAVMMLVPLVYLVLVLAQVQAGSLAAEGAARQAARSWVLQHDVVSADRTAAANARLATSDFGFDAEAMSWTRTCSGACLAPGTRVSISVEVRVPLPLVPAALTFGTPLSISMQSTATQTVSRFASTS